MSALKRAQLIREKIRAAGIKVPYNDRLTYGAYSLKVHGTKHLKTIIDLLKNDDVVVKTTNGGSSQYSWGPATRIIVK